MALEDDKVITIHPEGGINVRIRFHGDLSSSCFNTDMWVYVCLFSYLADISYSRSQLIPQPLHRRNWGFAEIRGLSVHHLDHHNTHWPNIHLVHHHTVKLCSRSHSTCLRYMRMVPTVFFIMAAFECAPPHLSAIWWFGDDFRGHPIGCPY